MLMAATVSVVVEPHHDVTTRPAHRHTKFWIKDIRTPVITFGSAIPNHPEIRSLTSGEDVVIAVFRIQSCVGQRQVGRLMHIVCCESITGKRTAALIPRLLQHRSVSPQSAPNRTSSKSSWSRPSHQDRLSAGQPSWNRYV